MEKFKQFLADDTVYFSLILILVGVSAFGLGRQSVSETAVGSESQVQIEYPPLERKTQVASVSVVSSEATAPQAAVVVGSKNGSKYHLPTCPGAKQIAEKNLLEFPSIAAAEAAGYTPALNCDGL